MLESGKRSLLLAAVTSIANNLAECYEIFPKEHGKDSKKYGKTLEYGKALLEWTRIERANLKQAANISANGNMSRRTPSRRGMPRCRRRTPRTRA